MKPNMRLLILSVLFVMNNNLIYGQFSKQKTIADYCSQLTFQPIENIHTELQAEAAQTDSLLKWVESIIFFKSGRVSFSSPGEIKDKKSYSESEPPFSLPTVSTGKIKKDFTRYTDFIKLYQKRYNGASMLSIEFDYSEAPKGLSTLRQQFNVSHTIDTIYKKGKAIDIKDLALSRVDSAKIKSSLCIPITMKTFTIHKKDTAIVLNDSIFNDFYIDEKTFEIDFPITFYQKVLAYQAVNKQGKYMKSSSCSSYPLYAVSKEVVEEIRQLRDVLTACCASNSKDEIRELLYSLSQPLLNDVKEITHVYNLCKDPRKTTSVYDEYVKQPLWDVTEMRIEGEFNADIEKMIFYIADKTEVIETERTITTEDEAKYYIQKERIYGEIDKNLFSLVDSIGKVIGYFPDSKYTVRHFVDNYFYDYDDFLYFSSSSYWLNEMKGCIELLPFDVTRKINNDLMLGKRKTLFGIVNNNNPYQEMLPFKYKSGYSLGDYLVMSPEEGFAEFYDLQLNKMENLNYYMIEDGESAFKKEYLIVKDTTGREGIMNKQLELTVPCIYEYIAEYGDNRLYVKNESQKCGIINFNNQVIEPFIYDFIYYSAEGLHTFSQGGKVGYMNEDFKIVIPAQFDSNYLFIEGYTLVVKGDMYGIINTKGQYVMQAKFTSNNRGHDYWSFRRTYDIDGKTYSYKGELIKQ